MILCCSWQWCIIRVHWLCYSKTLHSEQKGDFRLSIFVSLQNLQCTDSIYILYYLLSVMECTVRSVHILYVEYKIASMMITHFVIIPGRDGTSSFEDRKLHPTTEESLARTKLASALYTRVGSAVCMTSTLQSKDRSAQLRTAVEWTLYLTYCSSSSCSVAGGQLLLPFQKRSEVTVTSWVRFWHQDSEAKICRFSNSSTTRSSTKPEVPSQVEPFLSCPRSVWGCTVASLESKVPTKKMVGPMVHPWLTTLMSHESWSILSKKHVLCLLPFAFRMSPADWCRWHF